MDDTPQVNFVPERSRFELTLKGDLIGFMEVRDNGDTKLLPYIEIAQRYRGGAYSSTLLKEALGQLKEEGAKVVPLCPFIASYFRRHPEFRAMMI